MSGTGAPNRLTKAGDSSHIPRSMRARVGATTDPVPAGKVADTRTQHHFVIKPAGHDSARAIAKTPEELALDRHEAEKLQRTGRDHVHHKSAIQSGVDWNQAHKNMPSNHRGAVGGN